MTVSRWAYQKGLHDLGGGVHAYLQPDGSWGLSNAGLIVSAGESLLVDTLFDERLTAEMLSAMKAATGHDGLTIKTLVNTHANGDHTYGNRLVEGAVVIASRASAEEMTELPPAALTALMQQTASMGDLGAYLERIFGAFDFGERPLRLPTRTFEDELRLSVGGKEVLLYNVGPAHTRGDTLVHVPDDKAVFTGDILFIEGTPVMWAGPVRNWISACDRILAMDVAVVVPGHGPITDKGGVRRVREYLGYIDREARARFDAGLSAWEAAEDIALGDFDAWGDAERIVVNVDTLYHEYRGGGPRTNVMELFGAMARLAARRSSSPRRGGQRAMPNIHLRRIAKRLAILVAAALAAPACFGYDSRWNAVQRAKQVAVEKATPGELQPAPKTTEIGPAATSMRTLKVRARATPRYAAEVTDWPRQAASMLEDANTILDPTLHIRLELASAEPWPRSGTDDDLSALDDELLDKDKGQDVAWVVGLVGSIPRVEQSFHELGLARPMGKHFVMRAMNDAREFEAIDRELSWLSAEERRKLYHARKRHKATTVFLHELGHTLGAMHEPEAKAIMHPSYNPKATGYSGATVELLRLTLAHRLSPEAETEQAFSQKLLDLVERTSSSWVDKDRDATEARLKAALSARAQPAAPAAGEARKKAAAPEADLTPLKAPDQAIFKEATETLRAGNAREAREKAKPLFTGYPEVYAVADLRCQLAMAIGGDWDAVQAECASLLKFAPGASGEKR